MSLRDEVRARIAQVARERDESRARFAAALGDALSPDDWTELALVFEETPIGPRAVMRYGAATLIVAGEWRFDEGGWALVGWQGRVRVPGQGDPRPDKIALDALRDWILTVAVRIERQGGKTP